VKCVNWTKTDILIATPQMFYNVMTQIIHNKSNPINPQFIVIDEADLLLEIDQNVAKYMQNIIDLIRKDKNAVKNAKTQMFVE
jgi:superfamily II DNA/RNA helicase